MPGWFPYKMAHFISKRTKGYIMLIVTRTRRDSLVIMPEGSPHEMTVVKLLDISHRASVGICAEKNVQIFRDEVFVKKYRDDIKAMNMFYKLTNM
jgi:sRNA-binding carbon storage regulator CsrA